MESVKGLREKVQQAVGLSNEDIERLQQMKVEAAMRRIFFYGVIVQNGGTIHGRGNPATVAARRAKNKVARKQRRANRQR